jgi:hypothetical protein
MLAAIGGLLAREHAVWMTKWRPEACRDLLEATIRLKHDSENDDLRGEATLEGFSVTIDQKPGDRFAKLRPVLEQVGVKRISGPSMVVVASGAFRSTQLGTRIDVSAGTPRGRVVTIAAFLILGGVVGGLLGAATLLFTLGLIVPLALDLQRFIRADMHRARSVYRLILVLGIIVWLGTVLWAGLKLVLLVPILVLVTAGLALLPAFDWDKAKQEPSFILFSLATLVAAAATVVGVWAVGPLGSDRDLNNTVEAVVGPSVGTAGAFALCIPALTSAANGRRRLLVSIAQLLEAKQLSGSASDLRSPKGLVRLAVPGAAIGGILLGLATRVAYPIELTSAHFQLFQLAVITMAVVGLLGSLIVVPLYALLWHGRSRFRRGIFVALLLFAVSAPALLTLVPGGGLDTAMFGWFALLSAGGGIAFFFSMVQSFRDLWQAPTWPTAAGQILVAEARREQRGMRTFYVPYFEYAYSVGGRFYLGNRLGFRDAGKANYRKVAQRVDAYPIGSQIRVFFHPHDPADAVLEPRSRGQAWAELMQPLTAGLFFLGMAWFFVSMATISAE